MRRAKKDFTEDFCMLVKRIYPDQKFIALHRPIFMGNEKTYLEHCIDSNFVSSVGKQVDEFEHAVANFVGSKRAIACVNGTSALHAALVMSGVETDMQVLTQGLTFVATANAISYCGADPVFVDVDIDTLGMSAKALEQWLSVNTVSTRDGPVEQKEWKKIGACVPMHTFGLPCRINEISDICDRYKIKLIEDAAESLGSFFAGKHTGTFGRSGVLSFNGNKIITTGGGMIITDDNELAQRAKHMTTTSKVPHLYEYFHDQIGYNYRMPNLNAALGVAQIEMLDQVLDNKKKLTKIYAEFCENHQVQFIKPIDLATSNNWLNAIILKDRVERDNFLRVTNENGIMTRPIWNLMTELPMYHECENDGLRNAKWLIDRVVNIPSSAVNIG